MGALYLIAIINGARVGIESDRVESVVHVNDVIPVPKSNPAVAGLFALRSRVLTVIDSQVLVTGIPKRREGASLAVIANIGGHAFGLLVDAVEDVVSIEDDMIEQSINPGDEWRALVTGVAVIDDKMVMIIDPVQLTGGMEMIAA
jgi:purine-binding chemotaxis protein CheW